MSEERLTAALTHPDLHVVDSDPGAAVVVELLARKHELHARAIREAAASLLDLLRPYPCEQPLTLPSAVDVIERLGSLPAEMMHESILVACADDLLLKMAIDALRPTSPPRDPGEAAAIVRTIYVLIEVCAAQDEIDALERALSR